MDRGHSNSAHAALGGGGVAKMRANACMGEGGLTSCVRLRTASEWARLVLIVNSYIRSMPIKIYFLGQCMGFPNERVTY